MENPVPTAEITSDLVLDIFNIKRDGSNIVDEEDDDVVGGIVDPHAGFSEKAKELNATISTIGNGKVVEQKPEPVKEEKKEVPAMAQKTNIEDAVRKAVPNKLFGDIFEDDDKPEGEVKPPEPLTTPVATLSIAPPVEKPKEVMEETTEEAAQQQDSVAPDNEAHQPSAPMSETLSDPNGHSWKLTSPAPKYEKLYEEKRELLSKHLLKGGEIPFQKFYEELNNVSVDTNVPTWDTEEIGRRIGEVQKWRDRVKFIQLRVNSQYFVWSQILKILPGVLKLVEYERGKNEGIVYEHLNDFTIYFGHLEGLYESCAIVSKNLDGAYNSLSRQVAIQQPLQEFERSSHSPRPLSPQAQRWDGLKHANNAGASAPAQPKEAGKTAKPQDTTWGDVS